MTLHDVIPTFLKVSFLQVVPGYLALGVDQPDIVVLLFPVPNIQLLPATALLC